MVSSEPLGNTEKTHFEFSKIRNLRRTRANNDFDDNHGMYDHIIWPILHENYKMAHIAWIQHFHVHFYSILIRDIILKVH